MSQTNLPANWRTVRLGEYCHKPEYGLTTSATSLPSAPKFLRITDIQDEGVNWDAVPYCESTEDLKESQKLLSGDVVIARIGATTGKAYVIRQCPDAVFASYLIRVRTKPELLPEFLGFYLQTEDYWKQIDQNKGGRLKGGVNIPILQNLTLPLPTLSEQHAIARALRAVQEAREARRQELQLERERKAALMQHLFTHGTRGEARKQTEIGEMPESWRVIELKELCVSGLGVIQTGPFGSQLHASDYKESGIPVVNPTHLGFNTIVEDRLPFISTEDADRLSKHYLAEGDILISRPGDFSRYSYISEKFAGWLCGTGCLLIRLKNDVADNFFLSVSMGLETVQNYLSQNAVGSIMPNLNTRILGSLTLPLPPVEEQHLIAQALHSCDLKIMAIEQESALLEELFRAMMEELMTGRLRATALLEV